MYKVYNSSKNLIGYKQDNIITRNNKELCINALEIAKLKFGILSIGEEEQYKIMNKIYIRYGYIPTGVYVKNETDLEYIKACVPYIFKPVTCRGLFTMTVLTDDVDLRELDMSCTVGAKSMFACTTISDKVALDIEKFNTSSLEDLTRMFNSASMSKLDLTNWDTHSIKKAPMMFGNCRINHLKLSTNDYIDGVDITNIFCNSSILDLDLSKVKLREYAVANDDSFKNGLFVDCTIGSIILPETLATYKIKSLYKAFYRAHINDLDLSVLDGSALVTLEYAFFRVFIKNLKLPEDLTSCHELGEAFRESVIVTLDMSKVKLASYINVSAMFLGCKIDNLIINEEAFNKLKSAEALERRDIRNIELV